MMKSRHRPLMMHLTLAAGALAEPQFSKNQILDDEFWHGSEGREIKASMEKVIAGIRNYQLHNFRRPATDRPVIWQDGEVRLFHYAAEKEPKARILVIPSMINGSEILDLLPDRSFLKWLSQQGCDVFLIDWGDLTKDLELQSLDAALGMKMNKLLKWLKAQSDMPLTGLGYCMGGLLLAACDQLFPETFGRLCFIATPWDFKKDAKGNFSQSVTDWAKEGLPQIAHLDYMPAEWLQLIFAGVDASQIARKFSAFAGMDMESEKARLFVAVEDWVNGGSDLPTAIVQHAVGGWYVDNKPERGEWTVAGQIVDIKNIQKPSFAVLPGRDRIVPPDSARPFAEKIENIVTIEPDCGHISMMIGEQAESLVWNPFLDWLFATHQ